MGYVYLLIAILFEVLATSTLKMSEGFTKVWPSVAVLLGYGVAFYCLSLTLKTMKVGVAYAIWSAVGIVLVSVVGLLFFKQRIDVMGMVGMGLIVIGVIVLMGFSDVSASHS
ncbi:DMT family transporter [Poriferisphaera sp. WC338]|uniref:DMT family transporter n=1 Tax=Poriferisphaera sp. WC338 TaxID=3425129 RepID=UPI003D818783